MFCTPLRVRCRRHRSIVLNSRKQLFLGDHGQFDDAREAPIGSSPSFRAIRALANRNVRATMAFTAQSFATKKNQDTSQAGGGLRRRWDSMEQTRFDLVRVGSGSNILFIKKASRRTRAFVPSRIVRRASGRSRLGPPGATRWVSSTSTEIR
jgi:hypothetical protein